MTVTMLPTDVKRTTVSPVKADGTPSTAKLSNQSYSSSDPALVVAPDPADASGNTVILTGQGNPATVIVTASATATEPDGTTTETVTGALTVVLAVPPPAPAAALVFSPLV